MNWIEKHWKQKCKGSKIESINQKENRKTTLLFALLLMSIVIPLNFFFLLCVFVLCLICFLVSFSLNANSSSTVFLSPSCQSLRIYLFTLGTPVSACFTAFPAETVLRSNCTFIGIVFPGDVNGCQGKKSTRKRSFPPKKMIYWVFWFHLVQNFEGTSGKERNEICYSSQNIALGEFKLSKQII